MVDSLLDATGVLSAYDRVVEVVPATDRQMSAFHTREFIQALKAPAKLGREELEELGLVDDCPAFEGVYELAALEAGGSLQAAELSKTSFFCFLRALLAQSLPLSLETCVASPPPPPFVMPTFTLFLTVSG